MTPAWEKMIGKIVFACKKDGIKFILSNDPYVWLPTETSKDGTAGFFDGEAKILAVGSHVGWERTLLHEYCHMKQWIEEASWFSTQAEANTNKLWDHLAERITLEKEEVLSIVKEVVACERDCELRVLELIKKYPSLKVSKRTYIKQANAYLTFYGVVIRENVWYSTQSPSSCPYLLSKVPANRIVSIEEALNPSKRFIESCIKYCLEEKKEEILSETSSNI